MHWNSEEEARNEIKQMVTRYYNQFIKNDKPFLPGDRITYAARVFDEKELCNLTDATLDFWLTTGRFAEQFEKEFANFLNIKYASLVNSGSSMFKRSLTNQILQLNKVNAFFLTGTSQSGKTTFLKKLASPDRKYADLAEPALRSVANEEPVLFLQRYAPPVLIDNIQYAPELVPVIKDYARKHGKPGDFWLIATKEDVETITAIMQELGDKFACLELCGLSSAELDGRESTPFIPDMQLLASRMQNPVSHSVVEIYDRIWRGDKPAIYSEGADWQTFYAKLVQDILQRDIRKFVQLNDEMKFYRFCVQRHRRRQSF